MQRKAIPAAKEDEDAYLGEEDEDYDVMTRTRTCIKCRAEEAGNIAPPLPPPLWLSLRQRPPPLPVVQQPLLSPPPSPAGAAAAAAAFGLPRSADGDPWHRWGSCVREGHHRREKLHSDNRNGGTGAVVASGVREASGGTILFR